LATIDSQIVERVSYGLRAIISESRWCSVERYCNQELQRSYTKANARLIRELMQILKLLWWYFPVLKKQQINEINILCPCAQVSMCTSVHVHKCPSDTERVYPSSQLLNQRTNLYQIRYANAGSYKLVIFNFLQVVITTCRTQWLV
jgi:hypothetical protein